MDCQEFRTSYSDFRDGQVTDQEQLRRMALHLYTCHACAHFDASLQRGIRQLRHTARGLEVSAGFRDRLRARIAMDAAPAAPSRSGAIGLAALLILAAVAAVLRDGGRPPDQPVALVAEPAPPVPPMVIVNPGVPFVTFTDLSVPVFEPRQTSSQVEFPLATWPNLPR